MNDKELLELAAKAAGYYAVWSDATECFWIGDDSFAPLTDDGDALRLAVTCGFDIEVMKNKAMYSDADLCAMTRRAIVRAAAAIGKELP